jgi:hypothetical protein
VWALSGLWCFVTRCDGSMHLSVQPLAQTHTATTPLVFWGVPLGASHRPASCVLLFLTGCLAAWLLGCVAAWQDTLCWSVGSYPAPSAFSRALHEWVGIVCEYRVFLYDYMTHKVCARSPLPPSLGTVSVPPLSPPPPLPSSTIAAAYFAAL